MAKRAPRDATPLEYPPCPRGPRHTGPERTVRAPGPTAPGFFHARGRTVHGGPNKVEREYANLLECRKAAREIHTYTFETVKLILGDRCSYLPDFLVLKPDGLVEFHEVKTMWKRKKGPDRPGWQEDARVKIKVAARAFPWFRFIVAIRARDGWEFEEIKP